MRFFTFLLAVLISASCTTNTSDDLNRKSNLKNLEVLTFYQRSDVLFTGTENGIFKREIGSDSKKWSYIGLESDNSQVIDIIAWGDQEIMVVIGYDEYSPENRVIYKTEDGGNNWNSLTENFTGKGITNYLRRLSFDITSPDKVFALGGLPIARSTDRGLHWKTVYKTWQLGAFGYFIIIDPNNPNIIWSGGATNLLTPSVVKSSDGGDSWNQIKISENIEATVYDLIIKSNSSSDILAGLGGAIKDANIIRKSTDGGESWTTVFEGIATRTMTHSARNPETIYASGQNAAGSLFFIQSSDFGNTWQQVSVPGAPQEIIVNDIVSVMVDGREVLYFATNKGVYRYSFEE